MTAYPAPRQLALPFAHAPSYAGADFLPDRSNATARAWLDRTAEWPGHRLAIWGEAGSGKTHLLHRWAARHRALTPDPAALGPDWPDPWPDPAAPLTSPLAIDDADLAPERPLLHLLNRAAEARLPVLLAGRDPPARWPTGLPDLASRLRATTTAGIAAPEDALLQALLARLLAERQLVVPAPMQHFLLARLPRSPAVLREAAARLDRRALAAGGRVTRALAGAVAAEMRGEEDDDDDSMSSDKLPSRDPARLF